MTVAVTRALLQLSRSLDHVASVELGGRIIAALLPFVWIHLEFHLDSVCHLANQILAACLDYGAVLEKRKTIKKRIALSRLHIQCDHRSRSIYSLTFS